jgi:hypothetical protein
MGRSGYTDDYDDETNCLGLYRANVDRAIGGKRGQAFLREMAIALDAMPVKELVADEIVRDESHVCAIGSVAVARGIDVSDLDEYDAEAIGKTFGIAQAMAREIAFVNDDDFGSKKETPAERWTRVRAWVSEHLSPTRKDAP